MERPAEGPRERFQRTVVRIKSNFSDGGRGVSQLEGGPLKQEPAPHCRRSLFYESSKQPVKLCPAMVCPPRQLFRRVVFVQRIHDHFG